MQKTLSYEMIERKEKSGNNNKNAVFTPHVSSCRICQFAGFSTNCDFLSIGKCPVVTAVKGNGRIEKMERDIRA